MDWALWALKSPSSKHYILNDLAKVESDDSHNYPFKTSHFLRNNQNLRGSKLRVSKMLMITFPRLVTMSSHASFSLRNTICYTARRVVEAFETKRNSQTYTTKYVRYGPLLNRWLIKPDAAISTRNWMLKKATDKKGTSCSR